MIRQQAGQHFGSSSLAALSIRGRTWATLVLYNLGYDYQSVTTPDNGEERENSTENYYDREVGETTPSFEESVLYKVEDIATYLVEYVKFWDDWEVDRYGNANLESRDAIFDENHFSSIARPKDVIPNSVESQRNDHSDDVPSEISKPRK
ncbi:hypothetical protein Tco_1508267, partial [Tanacetum coccineum]